jgi:hypothetical protein
LADALRNFVAARFDRSVMAMTQPRRVLGEAVAGGCGPEKLAL